MSRFAWIPRNFQNNCILLQNKRLFCWDTCFKTAKQVYWRFMFWLYIVLFVDIFATTATASCFLLSVSTIASITPDQPSQFNIIQTNKDSNSAWFHYFIFFSIQLCFNNTQIWIKYTIECCSILYNCFCQFTVYN